MDVHSRPSRGDAVNVVVWFLLVSSVLATLARLLTKRALRRHLSIDDAVLVVAVVCLLFSIFVISKHSDEKG